MEENVTEKNGENPQIEEGKVENTQENENEIKENSNQENSNLNETNIEEKTGENKETDQENAETAKTETNILTKEVLKEKLVQFILKYKLQVSIASVVLLILIYFLFIYSPPFHRYKGLLPFIVDEKVAKILRGYLSTQPSRHAFLVTGPHGSGKSRLISMLSKEYTEGGNLSINLDFSLAKSAEEVIGFGKLSLIKSLQDYIKEDTRKAQFPAKQKGKKDKQTKQQKEQQQMNLNRKQSELKGVFSSLVNALNTSLTNSKGITEFFEILESIQESYHPAVFVYGGNNAFLYTPEMYSAIFSRLSQKDQYKDHIPIIFETTNTLLKNKDLPFFYRILELEGVDDPYGNFVHNTKCFTKSEMKKVLQTVGNNGGEIEAIFESLKVGHDINSAIEMRYKAANHTVSTLYNKKGQSAVLRELCGNDMSFYRAIPKTDALYRLAMQGYVYLDKTHSLASSTKQINNLIC